MYVRDKTGLTFTQKGRIIREVSRSYAEQYDRLMADDGLYQHLTSAGLMVKHSERGLKYAHTDDAYRVILPQPIPLETYAYEWGFSKWQAAALHVLALARTALEHDMVLRDADIDSVQFQAGVPIWTDTLAFALYREGQPWAAYTPFLQQYLAPLALMAKVDISLGRLLQTYPEGVPLGLASALLPGRTRLNFGLANHIHGNARPKARHNRTSRADFAALLGDLQDVINDLSWAPDETAWRNAAHITAGDATAALDTRQRVLRDALNVTGAQAVWDLNAGQGTYSRIAATEFGAGVVSFNPTPDVTEALWQSLDDAERERILPLLMDWANPSPGLGWLNHERRSIGARANADLLVAVGLLHRLALRDGITFPAMAAKFVRMAPALVIEFVPGSDPQMIGMMESGTDPMPDYTQGNFEAAFGEHYDIVQAEPVAKTPRYVYFMRRREG